MQSFDHEFLRGVKNNEGVQVVTQAELPLDRSSSHTGNKYIRLAKRKYYCEEEMNAKV